MSNNLLIKKYNRWPIYWKALYFSW